MNKNGPIVVIEDDKDDQEILLEIFTRLDYKNEIIFITDGKDLIEYISKPSSHPFFILSDVNMPKVNGFDLRNQLAKNEQLRSKCVPFLFFTTGSIKKEVVEAYANSVQGFFIKPDNLTVLENTIRKIVDYWSECIAPSYYD